MPVVSCISNAFCHPFPRVPISFLRYRGVTHAPLKRGGCTTSLWICRPLHGLLIQAGARARVIFHYSLFHYSLFHYSLFIIQPSSAPVIDSLSTPRQVCLPDKFAFGKE